MPEILKNISRVNIRKQRGDVVFGDVTYGPGGVCGPRMQQDYQLVIVHSGSLELRLDGKKIPVGPGHAILLSPGHKEHFLFSRDTETNHGWCAVDPSAVPARMRRLFRSTTAPAPFTSHLATLLKLGKTAPVSSPGNESLEDNYCFGLGLALLSGFAFQVHAGQKVKNPGDEALERMDEFISREYAQPLQLANLAAAAGVSRQHLMKLFRDRGWPTPTQYLYEKRLETALDWLSHTGLSVEEIGFRCGFANAFHFSRKFSQAYGKSPRAWRAQAWSRTRKKS